MAHPLGPPGAGTRGQGGPRRGGGKNAAQTRPQRGGGAPARPTASPRSCARRLHPSVRGAGASFWWGQPGLSASRVVGGPAVAPRWDFGGALWARLGICSTCCPWGGLGDCRPFHFRTFASRPRPGRNPILPKWALKKKSTEMSILVKRNPVLLKRKFRFSKMGIRSRLSYGFANQPAGTAIPPSSVRENQSALLSKAPAHSENRPTHPPPLRFSESTTRTTAAKEIGRPLAAPRPCWCPQRRANSHSFAPTESPQHFTEQLSLLQWPFLCRHKDLYVCRP